MVDVAYAWGERLDFARIHLESAAFLTRQAYEIEQDPSLPQPRTYEEHYHRDIARDERYIAHTSYVVSAIFSAVAAMDAAAAEPFIVAYEKQDDLRSPLEIRLATLWDVMKRSSFLVRAEAALRLVNLKPNELSSWEDVRKMRELRNFVMHYTGGTIWTHSEIPDEQSISSPEQLEQFLQQRNIERNPLAADRVFPLTYLSHACAMWALTTSKEFIEDFCQRLGSRSPFAEVEEHERAKGLPSTFAGIPPNP